jgi:TetR/AcrR family transcriptional regulator, regulator of autoinduction and epiphytic fitness
MVTLATFEESGYEGTSTDRLAQQANVSKATIYKTFGSKDELLLASVTYGCRKIRELIDLSPLDCLPIAEALVIVARNMLVAFWSEQSVRLLRLAISEARRLPHIAVVFMAAGAAPIREAFADCLAAATDRNELPNADHRVRADQFLSLLAGGYMQIEMLLHLRKRITEAEPKPRYNGPLTSSSARRRAADGPFLVRPPEHMIRTRI